MEAFEKILNPYRVPVEVWGSGNAGRSPKIVLARVFVRIKYSDDGRLSITGVEGPRSDGDAYGSCGQIGLSESGLEHLQPGWGAYTAQKLWEVWGDWHLNDMRPYSPEMKALGWHEQAKKPAWVWDFSRTPETRAVCNQFHKNAAAGALCRGVYEATPEEIAALAVPQVGAKLVTLTHEEPEAPRGMRRSPDMLGRGHQYPKPPEKKTLGWITHGEWTPGDLDAKHPEGLLGRKVNPEDSHGYGGKWWKEDVPEDVLKWLKSLPDADTKPAWV